MHKPISSPWWRDSNQKASGEARVVHVALHETVINKAVTWSQLARRPLSVIGRA